MPKIILVGYMGSGKSTVSQKLADRLSIKVLELDTIIEEKLNMSIPDIFKNKGELFFRKTEHTLLNEIVNINDDFVLSTGGGTPCYANNHEVLKQDDIVSVYLKASIPVLLNRINEQEKIRPLMENIPLNEREEFIAKHLFDRSYFYHQAKYTVQTDYKSPETIAEEIIKLLPEAKTS